MTGPGAALADSGSAAGRADQSPLLTAFDADTGIAWLTFNRPQVLNAIDLSLAQALLAAVRSLSAEPRLRCVVLTGAGRAFMSGGDVSAFAGGAEKAERAINDLLDALNPAISVLRALEAPVLAAVNGAAAGAGLSLALAADLIIAAEDARFLLAYDRIAAVPDLGGSWFLARKLGQTRAAELMLLSRSLRADEAQSWGLVSTVAPAKGFSAAAQSMAQRLASGPTRSYAAFRRLIDDASGAPLSAQLQAERLAFVAATQTEDFQEGVAAFLAGRPPRFVGR